MTQDARNKHEKGGDTPAWPPRLHGGDPRWRGYRSRIVTLFGLAILIGALAAVGALVFREAIVLVHHALWPAGDTFLQSVVRAPWWQVLLIPALAGLVAGPLIRYLAPEARGPGVPEVILAVTTRQSVIRHRVTFLKAIITSFLIGAGASVGREGPIVQIGASVGSSVARLFRMNPEIRRVCLASGAAAGISATFNAPMAGTMFAMEIILMDMEVAYVSHIVVASITASVLSRWFWGEFRVFETTGFELAHWGELGLYLALGILAGIVAVAFIRCVFGAESAFERIPGPVWLKPAMGGLLLGFIALAVPQVASVGYDTVNVMLEGGMLVTMAILVLGAKLVATSVCLGSGMSGGIFAPSLFIGAALGTTLCLGVDALFPALALDPSNYALVGMGALVAGTTLAPITAILTIFELTYSYEIILPIMLAAIAATSLVRLAFGYSIYEMKLLKHGHDIVRGRNVRVLRTLFVADHMVEAETIAASADFDEVVERMAESEYPHFVVVDEDGGLAGVLSLADLRPHLRRFEESRATISARDMMTSDVLTVSEEDNLETALAKFEHRDISALPVLKADTAATVAGLLKRDDVHEAYEQKIWKERLLSVPLK